MTIEVASRRPDGAATTQPTAKTTQRLPEPEPIPYRRLREEELMQFRTTAELIPHFRSAAQIRFPFHIPQLMGAVDIAITQYDGHSPRRDGTEAALHPVRTSYRALTTDPNITLVEAAIYVLHDTPEDCGLSQKDLADLLRMRGFSSEDAKRIAFGAAGLSRMEQGNKLSQTAYMEKIEATHWADPDLRLISGKAWDSIDNGRNDIWILISDPTAIDPHRVATFLDEKAEDVLALARRYAPHDPSTDLLEETILTSRNLVKREFKLREVRAKENQIHKGSGQTLLRRQTPSLPTARVPM